MIGRRRRRLLRRRSTSFAELNIQILPKHILIALCFVCFAIMFVSYKFPTALRPVKNAVDTIVAPMQIGINRVGTYFSGLIRKKKDLEKLRIENEELRIKLEEMTGKAQLTNQDMLELDRLRSLYKLDERYSDYPKVAARIIAREGNGFYNTFTVDKGIKDGIKEDMNVIAGNGLVGIVTEVRSNTSTICSIIDDRSNVSGMFSSSKDTCIVSGNMSTLKSNGEIGVSMISLNADVIENEEVITSHISDKYLQGILIGYIKDVEIDATRMTKEARLIPAVDFEHLDEVLIITEIKENYEMDK